MRLSRSCLVSSDTGHRRFETSLRSTRLQGLPEVGPARLLAAMLGDLGVSTLCLIKTMNQFSSFLSIKPAMLSASMLRDYSEFVFDALLFSSSYRPVGKFVSHHFVARSTFASFLFFGSSYRPSCRHVGGILLYECIFDALWIFSSSFRSIGSLLPIGRHSTSLRSARLQTGRLLS
jgi:hypothetical protein